jgi:hypothetical protein
MNATADDAAALTQDAQRSWYESADGGKDDRGIKLHWRTLI